MMNAITSANGPTETMMPLGEALAEPMYVASTWMQSPPWALVALLVLTIVLLALSNREQPPVTEV